MCTEAVTDGALDETLPQVLSRMMTNIKTIAEITSEDTFAVRPQRIHEDVEYGTKLAIRSILAERRKACIKFPKWQTDPIHALAVIQEEIGELTQAVLDTVYGGPHGGVDKINAEASQAGAMLVRFLENMSAYNYKQSEQA